MDEKYHFVEQNIILWTKNIIFSKNDTFDP